MRDDLALSSGQREGELDCEKEREGDKDEVRAVGFGHDDST